jgi:HlyD family secretion protein
MSAAKSRTTWGVLLVVVAIAIAAATLLRGSTEANTEVRLHKAEKRGVTARVLAQGKVKAKAQVDVSSEVAGRVAVVNVEVGDVVKVGDLLFSLDGEQLRNAVEQIGAALAAAEALLARADVGVKEAERAVERDQKLADKGVVTDDVLKLGESRLAGARADRAQANANVERARIDLNRAKDALRRAKVTAPQAGTVVAVGVEVGRVVSSTTGLSASPDASLGLGIGGVSAPVVIADLSELMVRLDVDELDVARLRVGQRAVVRAQGIKSAEFEGTVERVGLMGRDVMGAVLFVVDVKVTGVRPPSTKSASTSTSPSPSTPEQPTEPLPAAEALLRPGMSATAEIEVDHLDDVVAIPLAAVLEEKKEDDGATKPDRVFVVDDGVTLVARETPVKLGPAEGDVIAVLSGVAAGQRVVLGPFRALKDLKDGDKVVELKDDKDDKTKGKEKDEKGDD